MALAALVFVASVLNCEIQEFPLKIKRRERREERKKRQEIRREGEKGEEGEIKRAGRGEKGQMKGEWRRWGVVKGVGRGGGGETGVNKTLQTDEGMFRWVEEGMKGR